jgi:integrase
MKLRELWHDYRTNCDTFRVDEDRYRYARRIEKHWGHLFDQEVDAVRRADVRRYRESLGKRDYHRSTCNWVVSLLSSLYRYGADIEVTGGINPCYGLKPLKIDDQGRELYIPDLELVALLDHLDAMAPDARIRQIVVIALNTGMRRGEIERCQWKHLDWRAAQLEIPPEVAKSRKERFIPLNETALDVFAWMRRAVTTRNRIPSGLIWPGRRDSTKPWSMIPKEWRALQAQIGLPHRVFHILRHQYATTAMRNGQSISHLQACLGHATPAQTMIYAHLQPGHLTDVARAVDTRQQLQTLRRLLDETG